MTQELPPELQRALATVARVPRVLIACDYDGTTAPIVGSHGSEFDTGFVHAMDDDAKALLRKIKDALGAIAAEYPGVAIEIKPASIALHVRNAEPADADEALKKAHAAAQSWDAQITEGTAVLEFAVIQTDKGQALDILRHQQADSAAVFSRLLGDANAGHFEIGPEREAVSFAPRPQAEALFDRMVTAAGPTGLLSEEYDPVAERALGNHPQDYSHLGLLRCAQLLGA